MKWPQKGAYLILRLPNKNIGIFTYSKKVTEV